MVENGFVPFLMARFPDFRDYYETYAPDHLIGETSGNYVKLALLFFPWLDTQLRQGSPLLPDIFTVLEAVARRNEIPLRKLLLYGVLELLSDESTLFSTARDWMGPETARLIAILHNGSAFGI